MKELYARTENDFEDQTFKALPARSSGLHLDLRLETLETSVVNFPPMTVNAPVAY